MSSIRAAGTRQSQLYFSQVEIVVDGSVRWVLLGENIELTATLLMPALRLNVSRRQGRTCPLSACVKFEQIALRGLVRTEKSQRSES